MLKDNKSAIHLGVTSDKAVCNSNGTEQFLNFLLFNNNNIFLFSNHNVTHMHVSKQYNENRGERAFLTLRNHRINILPSRNFLPKIVMFTGTVPFTYFVGYSESLLA